METESQNRDYKSLRKAIGKQADLKSLAETCVSMMMQIKKRLKEIDERDIQKTIYKMANSGKIHTEGADKNRVYYV
jgi:hypothetical protein